jgi:glutathione-regulated potassium-efflux system ancillary protein KefC
MGNVWLIAGLWLVLALVATLLSIWFHISTALSEIVVGTVAQLIIGALVGTEALGAKSEWVAFLAGTGAIVLTFLAGAELDPSIFRTKSKEAFVVGLVGFFAPFLGAAAVARFILHWTGPASWLTGIALSTTSVAVVYAVMLELGLNKTEFGKGILAACFVNDLGTVIALGLIFAPFTYKTGVFVGVCVAVFAALPFVTPWFFRRYGGRVSELEAKFILFFLFAMGGAAVWAGSEAVLPAYIIGMVLAGTVGKDHILVVRLRTLTFGLLTPFYFIRAGSLVSVPALIASPFIFLVLLAAKMISKMVPLVPTVRAFDHVGHQGMYYSLMMSTGLTFGTISALFGLNHNIIDQTQYSHLVATVIGSAIIPTAIANAFFMPKHLLPSLARDKRARVPVGAAEEAE